MARRFGGPRALGPYYDASRDRWRVILVDQRGQKDHRFYASERSAKQVARSYTLEMATNARTVAAALAGYERYMRNDKGNKSKSTTETIRRLNRFFEQELNTPLAAFDGDETLAQDLYDAFRERKYKTKKGEEKSISVDYHRNTLSEARSFLRWCVKKRKWLRENPFEAIEGVGRRHHGKKQLHIDEARKWEKEALELAASGKEGAVAAMMTLFMNMRCVEIVTRVVRDLDDDGHLLWIPDSKTDAGKRTLEVPEVLVPHLKRLADGKKPEARLFSCTSRNWPRDWVQRICEKAGVPKVTAHGMRGLHSTIAKAFGATSHAIALAMGHESSRTTDESYIDPAVAAATEQQRALRVLQGGRR